MINVVIAVSKKISKTLAGDGEEKPDKYIDKKYTTLLKTSRRKLNKLYLVEKSS